jgi:hypothetical protein
LGPAAQGECTIHAASRLHGLGIFLLLRKSNILLIRGDTACFYSSVYVDEHGETDEHLRRGRPLFLNARRYDALQQLWCSHGVARKVAQMRNTSDMIIRLGYF